MKGKRNFYHNSMTKNQYILIIVGAIAISISAPVFATSPVPAPVCQLEGTITSASYKPAWKHSCLTQGYQCPTDTPLEGAAHYSLEVRVNNVSYVSGPTTNVTCQSLYSVGTENTFLVSADKVKTGDVFSVNQKINGNVTFFFDNWFSSYNLSGVVQQVYLSDLSIGMKSPLVEKLQRDLARDSSIYPEKLFTGYFGQLTLKAVKRFQAKHGIRQTGYVGPLTRARLNSLNDLGDPVNYQIIIKTVGEREGTFTIQRINPDSVEGLWGSGMYPSPGSPTEIQRTFRISDDIKYCGGPSEKIVGIDFSGQKVTFKKSLVPAEPCPS